MSRRLRKESSKDRAMEALHPYEDHRSVAFEDYDSSAPGPKGPITNPFSALAHPAHCNCRLIPGGPSCSLFKDNDRPAPNNVKTN